MENNHLELKTLLCVYLIFYFYSIKLFFWSLILEKQKKKKNYPCISVRAPSDKDSSISIVGTT